MCARPVRQWKQTPHVTWLSAETYAPPRRPRPPLPERDDRPAELVTGKRERRLHALRRPLVPAVDVQVGAADRGRLDADQDLVGPRCRDGDLFQHEARLGPRASVRRASSPRPHDSATLSLSDADRGGLRPSTDDARQGRGDDHPRAACRRPRGGRAGARGRVAPGLDGSAGRAPPARPARAEGAPRRPGSSRPRSGAPRRRGTRDPDAANTTAVDRPVWAPSRVPSSRNAAGTPRTARRSTAAERRPSLVEAEVPPASRPNLHLSGGARLASSDASQSP